MYEPVLNCRLALVLNLSAFSSVTLSVRLQGMQNSRLDDDFPNIREIQYCRCLIDCPDGKDNSTCVLKPKAKCFKKLYINEFGEEELRAGCLASIDEQVDQCNKRANPDFATPTDLHCCNNGSMCNDHLIMKLPALPPKPDDAGLTNANLNMMIVISLTVLSFCILFGTIIVMYCIRTKRREKKRKRQIEIENLHAECPVLYPHVHRCRGTEGHRPVNDLLKELSPLAASSSGVGMPFLVQRTISKQIELVRDIASGRYGSVKLGKWRNEYVALKIFNPKDKESWYRETEIYQTVMLRHDNILGFIAADISGVNLSTQLFLITEYHPNGSLYDYLQDHVLDVVEAVKLALSACAGLAHLHTEITGTQGKPAIAHRDVKSKNILVKNDGQCCIADMGLAVQYSRQQGRVNFGWYETSRRKGTMRYMAPEVITQSFHPHSFEPYKAADVYSFALVMWEIANRTRVKGSVDVYHLPYYDVLSNDPDIIEVEKVVVVEKMRPDVLPEWELNKIMRTYVTTMQECWHDRYESRLSMLRVRKTLSALVRDDRKVALEGSTSSSDCDKKGPIGSTTASNSVASDLVQATEPNTQSPLISTFEV